METKTNAPYLLRIVRIGDESECWQVRAMLESGEVLASVKLRVMYECACVGVIFHLETREEYRRQGIATALLAEVEKHAIASNISLLISTVRMYNYACRELHVKAGFTEECAWNNAKTGNDLVLERKVLRLAGGNRV